MTTVAAGVANVYPPIHTSVQPGDTRLTRTLRALVAARLLVEEGPGLYAFRHSLTRDAVYFTLLRAERTGLHRSVGETLENIESAARDARSADLAFHFFEAGNWVKALDYSGRAAEQAQAMYASREAIELAGKAIQAASRLGIAPPASLHRIRGRSLETLGEFDQALSDYTQSLKASRSLNDRRAEWQGLIDIGYLWASRDYGKSRTYVETAVEVARAIDDPYLVAHSLNRLGNWHVNRDQPLQAIRYHQEALKIFQSLNHRPGLAESFDLLGLSYGLIADWINSEQNFREAITIFREIGDLQGLASALANEAERSQPFLTMAAVAPAGLADDPLPEIEEALKISRQIGWRAGEAYALIEVSLWHGTHGRYGQALAVSDQALHIAVEIEHRQWQANAGLTRGMILFDVLALEEAQAELEHDLALAREVQSTIFSRLIGGMLAATYAGLGRLEDAEALVAELLSGVEPGQELSPGGQPVLTVGVRVCLAAKWELALARGDTDSAHRIVNLVASAVPAPELSQVGALPALDRMRAEVLLAQSRPAEALRVLDGALDTARPYGLDPLIWRIHTSRRRALLVLGQTPEAEAAYEAGHVVIERLAATLPDASLRQKFVRRALVLLDAPPGHSRPFGG